MSDAFVLEIEAMLRAQLPDIVARMPDAAVATAVRQGIEQAAEYGITDVNCLRRFLWFYFRFRGKFGTTPETSWAGAILVHRELTQLDKILALERVGALRVRD